MATLADVKKYLEADPGGKKVPMSEIKELTGQDREELIASLTQMVEKGQVKI